MNKGHLLLLTVPIAGGIIFATPVWSNISISPPSLTSVMSASNGSDLTDLAIVNPCNSPVRLTQLDKKQKQKLQKKQQLPSSPDVNKAVADEEKEKKKDIYKARDDMIQQHFETKDKASRIKDP